MLDDNKRMLGRIMNVAKILATAQDSPVFEPGDARPQTHQTAIHLTPKANKTQSGFSDGNDRIAALVEIEGKK